MKKNMKKILIGSILSVLVLLLGLAAWLMFRKPTETGEQVAKNKLNVEWYDENAKEFTITTREELFDLIELSYFYDFAGQTIKLGADIVVNEGNAADWQTSEPEYEWESIYGFAGTFDGQGHTISGLYSIGLRYFANIERIAGTNYITASLFRDTQKECVIKNFKIVNSYFESDLNHGVGSVSSNGGGTFENIYSDVIIRSQKCYVGGIVGNVSDDATITNCWFDDSLEIFMKYGRYVGGIVGRTTNGADCTIEHCLVTATMTSDVDQVGNQFGGILGQSYQSKATIKDCLMAGKVYDGYGIAGSVVGNVAPESTTTISDVYTCADSHKVQIGIIEKGKLEGQPIVYDRDTITGLGGYQWTTLDFENYWATVEGGTPVLKTFAADTLSLEGVAKKIDTSWYNEEEKTYVLMDEADFYGFALLSNETNFEGKTIKLGADLKLNEGKASSWKKDAPDNQWMCIGTKNLPFAGTFDGQMHTISGVYLQAKSQYSGLFGVTTQKAVIKRFKLVNSYFESDEIGLGSIAGQGIGTFDTIYSDAIVVNDKGCIGGMIGRATEKKENSIKMTNCWFDGTVINTSNSVDNRTTGGFIGFVVAKTELSNCLNTGTIDVRSYKVPNDNKSEHVQPYAGGLFGWLYTGFDVSIKDCMNTGKILMSDAVTSAAGSIMGYSSGTTTISNTYVTKESSKFTTRGNIKGEVIVYEKAQIVGYGGYQWTGLDFNKYWAVVLDDTSVLKSFAKKVPSLAGVEKKADISWYNAKADTYILYDAADLRGFALISKTTNFKGKTVKLANDIVLNSGDASTWSKTAPETEWMSIGTVDTRFAGTFDGQKHTISGVYMNTDEKYTGFFSGTADEAVVKNFRLTNSYFYSSQEELGSIVGNGRGKFDGIYSSAIVESSNNVAGGLIGSTSWDGGVKVSNCWFDGEVTNVEKAGSYYAGILARAYRSSTITNSLNTGTITCDLAKQPRAGGIFGGIGRSGTTLDISYCLNTGKLVHGSKTKEQGLLVGYAIGTINLENSYSIAQGSDTLVATKADKTYPTCGAAGSAEDAKGTAALANAAGLFVKKNSDGKYENHWVAVLGGAPVPKKLLAYTSGEQFTPDVSWYDGSKEYTLTTKEQLFGLVVLSYLSELDGFAGKTIKLGADITINEGNAADWKQNAPKYAWGSIGDSTAKFKGNFDGQKHIISGIYQNTTKQCQGFIGDATGDVQIANFSLENCYFNYYGSKAAFIGAVAGRTAGQLENIYVDAIVESTGARTAGLVGSTGGKLTIVNCWNAGPVSSASTDTGSMVGYVDKVVTIKNCLNTGDISTTYTKEDATEKYALTLGGFLGKSVYGTGLYNCLNLGAVNYIKTDYSTDYGMMVGSLAGGTTFQDLVTIRQANAGDFNGTMNSTNVTKVNSLDDIKGTKALDATKNLFTLKTANGKYESAWSVVPNGTPVLTSFAKYAGEKHLAIDASWYDAEKTNYKLKNASDLYGLAVLSYKTDFEGKTIELTDDIIVNADITNPEYGWLSIGDSTAKFKGSFNGKTHTISGVYQDTTKQCQGFFGDITGDVLITNFSLVDSYFEYSGNKAAFIGAVAGRASGRFENIYTNATVHSTGARTAGFVGSTAGVLNITNCWNAGPVSSASTDIGSMVGYVDKVVTLKNCLNTGAISTTYKNDNATSNYALTIGGFLGKSVTGTGLYNCLNLGEVSYIKTSYSTDYGMMVGSLAGGTTFKDLFTIKQANAGDFNGTTNSTNVTKINSLDDIKGTKALESMKNLFALQTTDGNYESAWSVVPNGTPVLTSFAKYAGEKHLAIDASWYDAEKTSYKLKNASDLYGLAVLSYKTNFEGKTIELSDDVTVNADIANPEYGWLSIGDSTAKFKGSFNGKMHTISGVYQDTTKQCQGFFGDITGDVQISNFSLENSYFNYHGSSAAGFLGAVAGRASGSFENIYVNATVQSTGARTAGFVGSTAGVLNITNCWNAGPVSSASTDIGSMVGYVDKVVTLKNCLNTGAISTTYKNDNATSNYALTIGGFLGKSVTGTGLYNCLNLGMLGYVKTTYSIDYGMMVGSLAGGTTFKDLFTIKQTNTGDFNGTMNSGNVTKIDSLDDIQGDKATVKIEALLNAKKDDGESYWSVVPNGHPVLTTFVKKATNQ